MKSDGREFTPTETRCSRKRWMIFTRTTPDFSILICRNADIGEDVGGQLLNGTPELTAQTEGLAKRFSRQKSIPVSAIMYWLILSSPMKMVIANSPRYTIGSFDAVPLGIAGEFPGANPPESPFVRRKRFGAALMANISPRA